MKHLSDKRFILGSAFAVIVAIAFLGHIRTAMIAIPAKKVESPNLPTVSSSTESMPSDLATAFVRSRHALRGSDEDGDTIEESYLATNPGEMLNACFMNGAARFSHDPSGASMEFKLAGSEGCKPSMADWNRLEYRHGVITEWYENGEAGIEHGFILESRPVTDGDWVKLSVHVGGGLVSAEDPDSPGDLLFLDAMGNPVFDYRNLKVWDATGRVLEARMKPESDGFVLACNDNGAVYPLNIDPLIGSFEKTLAPSDGKSGDEFGVSVAVSGDTAVIGAHLDTTSAGSRSGSAYVYRNISGAWVEEAKLVGKSLKANDAFGFSVAISGNTILVGAPLVDLEPDPFDRLDGGAAYVFKRNGSTWSQTAVLRASNESRQATFGRAVSLDGSNALIGARQLTGGFVGRAYIFSESAGVWNQAAILNPSKGEIGDRFGESVSISGSRAVVGAPGADVRDPDEFIFETGAAYVFEKGVSWIEKAVILNPNPFQDDHFGASISSDSTQVAIGEPGGGVCHVYEKIAGKWQRTGSGIGDDLEGFGGSVAISGDILVCGSPFADGSEGRPDVGTITIFENTGGSWIMKPEIGSPSGQVRTLFGSSVAVSGDLIVAGSPRVVGVAGNAEDPDFLVDRGAAYVFRLAEGEPRISIREFGQSLPISSYDFGLVRKDGDYKSVFLLIRNDGTGDLQGVTATVENDFIFNPEFTLVDEPSSAIIPQGLGRILEVRFLPALIAERSAILRITSNDPDHPELLITLSGEGTDKSEYEIAASVAGLTGSDALPESKPFGDSVPNLVKFAFGLDLSKADERTMQPDGNSGLPFGKLVTDTGGEFYRLIYLRRTDGSLTYTPQKSRNLENGSFDILPATDIAQSIPDMPGWERVTVKEPVNTDTERARFFRVKVEAH